MTNRFSLSGWGAAGMTAALCLRVPRPAAGPARGAEGRITTMDATATAESRRTSGPTATQGDYENEDTNPRDRPG